MKNAIQSIMSKSGVSGNEIKAIGISYQMHGLVVVDKEQRVLRPAIIWCDSRAVPIGQKAAKDIGLRTVLLCSQKTGELLRHSDVAVIVPSDDTARIQEVHLAVLHIISKLVEEELA